MFAVIDFETRSEVDIKVGVNRYSLAAEPLCLSYHLDGQGLFSWEPGQQPPLNLFAAIAAGAEVFAHNVDFEIAIWRNVMVAKYGWPDVPDRQWRCTMAECYAAGLPGSLEVAAKALELGVQKDMEGRRLMLKMAKPRKPTKKDPDSKWHESAADRQRLVAYCEQDVRTELAIHGKVKRLTTRELQIFQFDRVVNQRGVLIDVELAQCALELWEQHTEILTEKLKHITDSAVRTPKEVSKMLDYLSAIGIELPDLEAGTVRDTLRRTDLPDNARELLLIRKELALSSVAKYKKMLDCVSPDNRLRGCFQYHGAQTGRWAGRLVQLHNLPRGMIKAEEIPFLIKLVKNKCLTTINMLWRGTLGELLSSLLRSAVVAPPDRKLIVCDFAGVEARGLAWAANEKWLLQSFREGNDIYKEMAAEIYGIPVSEVTKDQRFIGKTAILGCGYQLGASRFQQSLLASGVEAKLDFCQKVIDAYRSKNSKIKSLWWELGEAAISAVKQPGKAFRAGPYMFAVRGDWLLARLPVGRDICYYRPRITPGKFGEQITYTGTDETGRLCEVSTYGGKLCENVTQAICRDMLVEAMARLEKRGYPVVAHVHDEIVCEVGPEGSIHEMEEIMKECPSWATWKGEQFPVNCEGYETELGGRYRK